MLNFSNLIEGYLDLTQQVWKKEQFQTHVLWLEPTNSSSSQPKVELLAYHHLKQAVKKTNGYVADLTNHVIGISSYLYKERSTSIYTLKNVLDSIALKELTKQEQYISDSSFSSRVHFLDESLEKLKNLQENLKNHDHYIEEYNKAVVFKTFKGESNQICPQHIEILKKIDTQINIILQEKEALQNEALYKFKRAWEEKREPSFNLSELGLPKPTFEYYNYLANLSYIENEKQLLSKGLCSLSEGIPLILNHFLGFNRDREGRSLYFNLLEEKLTQVEKNKQLLRGLPFQELKEEIRKQAFEQLIALSQLNQEQQQRVVEIMLLIDRGEEIASKQIKTIQTEFWKKILKSCKRLDKEQFYKKKIAEFRYKSNRDHFWQNVSLETTVFNSILDKIERCYYKLEGLCNLESLEEDYSEEALKYLKTIRQEWKVEKLLKKEAEKLKRAIESSRMDETYIKYIWPQLEENLKKASPLQSKSWLEHYSQLINQSYLEGCLSKIARGENILTSIQQQTLVHLGLMKQLPEYLQLREMLQESLDKLSLSTILPIDLIKQINMKSRQAFIKRNLKNSIEQERLSQILNKIEDLEWILDEAFRKVHRQLKKQEIRTVLENMKKLDHSPEELKELQKQFTAFQVSPSPPFLSDFYTLLVSLDDISLKMSEEQFLSRLNQLDVLIDNFKQEWSPNCINRALYKQTRQFLKKIDPKKMINWSRRNKKAQCFSFRQNQWGSDQILEGGVCAGLNYLWIKQLIKRPIQLPITRVEDVQGEEQNFEGIPPRARLIQALSSLSFDFHASNVVGMPQGILKADKLEQRILIYDYPASSINTLVEEILKRNADLNDPFKLKDSNGTISIYMYTPKASLHAAHVIGMQLDPVNHIYRFWDVNKGFYEYRDLEEMKQGFESCLQYLGWEHSFSAAQFYPKH